jgi:hypothetical protein
MFKRLHRSNLQGLAAILPSAIVAAIHFRLSTAVGPRANEVFQHWFDTGEQASGADALIQSLSTFLSKPIPAVYFAGHPAYPPPLLYWLTTILNSLFWGIALYACYRFGFWFFKRLGMAERRL